MHMEYHQQELNTSKPSRIKGNLLATNTFNYENYKMTKVIERTT